MLRQSRAGAPLSLCFGRKTSRPLVRQRSASRPFIMLGGRLSASLGRLWSLRSSLSSNLSQSWSLSLSWSRSFGGQVIDFRPPLPPRAGSAAAAEERGGEERRGAEGKTNQISHSGAKFTLGQRGRAYKWRRTKRTGALNGGIVAQQCDDHSNKRHKFPPSDSVHPAAAATSGRAAAAATGSGRPRSLPTKRIRARCARCIMSQSAERRTCAI